MWSTASQEQEKSYPASHLDKEEGITMSREGEPELHKEEDKEDETEETHPREEEAETAVTQEFASIVTKSATILPLLFQNQKEMMGRLKEG